MAFWQYTKQGMAVGAETYDDQQNLTPGDEGFSYDLVKQNMPADADGFNYVGPSSQNLTE